MPRFVVLLHETPAGYARPDHFDLMLEHGDVLWTWSCERLPEGTETIVAERLPDHRPLYLEFEGELSQNRGSVRRVDAGDYELLRSAPHAISVRLHGAKHRGTLTLIASADAPGCWQVAWSP